MFFTNLADRYFPLHPPIVGIDISSRTVKVALLERARGQLRLRAWGERSIKEGIIEGGFINSEDALITTINEAWSQMGISDRDRWAVVSLPEEQVFIRLISLPVLPEDEIARAIDAELEANIPLTREEIYVDWFLLPPETDKAGTHQDVLLAAVSRRTVDALVRLFDRANIKIVAIEPESQAFARIVNHGSAAGTDNAVLIVDIGATATRILVLEHGLVRFSTTLSTASELMTKVIAGARGIEHAEAERLKRYVGIENTKEGRELFIILEPCLKDILTELARAVDYWEEHAGHHHGASIKIERLFMSGGGANLKGLEAFLGTHLQMPVSALNAAAMLVPSGTLAIAPSFRHPAVEFDPTTYTAVLGLALRGIDYSSDVSV